MAIDNNSVERERLPIVANGINGDLSPHKMGETDAEERRVAFTPNVQAEAFLL